MAQSLRQGRPPKCRNAGNAFLRFFGFQDGAPERLGTSWGAPGALPGRRGKRKKKKKKEKKKKDKKTEEISPKEKKRKKRKKEKKKEKEKTNNFLIGCWGYQS